MSPAREAFVLPLVFLTVALLGGLDPGAPARWSAPALFSLLLAVLLVGAFVRSGALAPQRLLDASRSMLGNANGAVVLAALCAASAQLFHMLTPSSGLPSAIVGVLLLVLLINTLVVAPDRVRMLRSLGVTVASAFILKFVILDALADPAGGRTKRVLVALFDVATLGTITQDPLAPAAGYVAFFTALLFLIGVALLPSADPTDGSLELTRSTSYTSRVEISSHPEDPAIPARSTYDRDPSAR